jgi:O-antigen/teichoic acid export membrane protein
MVSAVTSVLHPLGRLRVALGGSVSRTTACNIAILATNAVTGIISARALGPSGRGELAMALLWMAFIQTAGSLGMLSSCSYYVARWPDRRAAFAVWLTKISMNQAVVITGISALVLWWLHLHSQLPVLLIAEFLTWPAATMVTLYGACFVQGLGDFRRFNSIRLLPGAFTAALMSATAMSVHLTSVEAAASYVSPAVVSAIITFGWLREAGRGQSSGPILARERRAAWSYGFRSLASFSGLTLNLSGDQLALGLLLPSRALGLYTVGASASSPLASIVSSYGMVGLPTVATLTGRAKARATWRTMRRATCMTVVIAPALALALPWAIPYVYGASYRPAVLPGELLLLGAAFAALTTVVDNLLRANGLPGFVSIGQGFGAAVTIVGAVLVVHRSLAAVALLSTIGFGAALLLSLARLAAATRRCLIDSDHAYKSENGTIMMVGRHTQPQAADHQDMILRAVRRGRQYKSLIGAPASAGRHRRSQ